MTGQQVAEQGFSGAQNRPRWRAAERGQTELENIDFGNEAMLAASAVAAAEIPRGIHRTTGPQRRAAPEAIVEAFLGRVPVIPFDMLAARVHAQISADLARQGITVGADDLLIAATALPVGGRVATRNLRGFPRIPGLEILACRGARETGNEYSVPGLWKKPRAPARGFHPVERRTRREGENLQTPNSGVQSARHS